MNTKNPTSKPTRKEAEDAVKTLISWAGDDPTREGLIETPKRVVKSYEEFYDGYGQDPAEILSKVFEEIEGYDEIVLVKDILLESHCEHHMVPILGKAHVAYLPDKRVVGLSKLARTVEIFSKRLQTQERLTMQIANTLMAQIADTINDVLKPKGVAVVIDAEHQCMSSRGVSKKGTSTVTSRMLGVFRDNQKSRMEFMNLIAL